MEGSPLELASAAHILKLEGKLLAPRVSWAPRREEGIPSRERTHAKAQGQEAGPTFRAEGDTAEDTKCGPWVKAFHCPASGGRSDSRRESLKPLYRCIPDTEWYTVGSGGEGRGGSGLLGGHCAAGQVGIWMYKEGAEGPSLTRKFKESWC